MPGTPLPSRAEFLKTGIRRVESCGICLDPFSDTHIPAVLPCRHVFSEGCLKEWFGDDQVGGKNTCPMCRDKLFWDNASERFENPQLRRTCQAFRDRMLGLSNEDADRFMRIFRTMLSMKDIRVHPEPQRTFVVINATLPLFVGMSSRPNDPFVDFLALPRPADGTPSRSALTIVWPITNLITIIHQTCQIVPPEIANSEVTSRMLWELNKHFSPAKLRWENLDAMWPLMDDPSDDKYCAKYWVILLLSHDVQKHLGALPGDIEQGSRYLLKRVLNIFHGWSGAPPKRVASTLFTIWARLYYFQNNLGYVPFGTPGVQKGVRQITLALINTPVIADN